VIERVERVFAIIGILLLLSTLLIVTYPIYGRIEFATATSTLVPSLTRTPSPMPDHPTPVGDADESRKQLIEKSERRRTMKGWRNDTFS